MKREFTMEKLSLIKGATVQSLVSYRQLKEKTCKNPNSNKKLNVILSQGEEVKKYHLLRKRASTVMASDVFRMIGTGGGTTPTTL